MTNEIQSPAGVFVTDTSAKARAAAQIVHGHSDSELAYILARADSDLAELIRVAAARLGRRL